MSSTPEQFAHKLGRMAHAVKDEQRKAVNARAQITQRFIVVAAEARTRKASPRWVRARMISDDTAEVRLRGGYAHLFQLGSYKHSEGWEERPKKVSARRRSNAAKRGVTLTASSVLSTPYGPRASVHHPPVAAKPFFREGVDAARTPGHNAYKKVVMDTIAASMR